MKTNGIALNQLRIERNEIENELIAYRQILAASPNAILITNTQIETVFVNPAWETLTGYTFDEIAGKNPRILQSGKTTAVIYRKLWQSLTQSKPFTTRDMINKRKDGTEYYAHSSFFP